MSTLTIPAARRSMRCLTALAVQTTRAPTVRQRRPVFFLLAIGRPALQKSDALAEKVATAWLSSIGIWSWIGAAASSSRAVRGHRSPVFLQEEFRLRRETRREPPYF
jgi:hypothetical protein